MDCPEGYELVDGSCEQPKCKGKRLGWQGQWSFIDSDTSLLLLEDS